MNNLTLLQQIRGSMRNPEPLSEENFCKVAEPGLTFAEAKKACAAAGVDIGKILVDLQRTICNIYYADYESGVYFVVELTSSCFRAAVRFSRPIPWRRKEPDI